MTRQVPPSDAPRLTPLRTLHAGFLGVVALAVVAILGLWAYGAATDRATALARAEAAAGDAAAVAEAQTRRVFATAELLAEAVAASVGRLAAPHGAGWEAALRGDAAAHREFAAFAARMPTSGVLWLVGADGRLVLASERFPADPSVEFTDRPWFRTHAEGARTAVGEALVGRVNREVFFLYGLRLEDPAGPPGSFGGVVLLSLRPSLFDEIARALGPGATVTVLREDGRLVARSPLDPAAHLGRDYSGAQVFRLLAEGRAAGTYRAPSRVDGDDRIWGFRHMADLGLVLTAGIATGTVLGGWEAATLRSGLAVAAAVLALVGAAVPGAWAIRRAGRTQAALAAAVAERDLLFQEVHHRVKNNLATVGGLLSVQARRAGAGPEVRDALEQARERVMAIAGLHDILYRTGDAASVEVPAYLGRLVEELAGAQGAAARGIVVRLDATRAAGGRLDMRRAVPVALALTEAATNALKYAFRDRPGGEVVVRAERDPDGGWRFAVADDGVGLGPAGAATVVEERGGGTLGLRLIRALAAQAGGRMEIGAGEGGRGTVVRFNLPAAAAAG